MSQNSLSFQYADKEDKHQFLKEKSALDVQVDGSHYKDMKIQPVEFITANNISYREANVIKYTCRHKAKNGIKDIKKAIHYLEMIMEDYERGEENVN